MRLVFYGLLALTAAGALTTAFLTAEPPTGSPAGAAAGPAAGQADAGAPPPAAPDPAELQALQRAAATANRGFAEEPGARLAVLRAVKAQDEETVKAILIHEGFTSDQVANVPLVLQDHSGGGAPSERIKVTVTASCCPLKITLAISL